MPVENRLFEFWKQREIALNREITVMDVARATGLSRATVHRFKEGGTARFDADVVGKLCEYFDVPEGPVPFLVWKPAQTEK